MPTPRRRRTLVVVAAAVVVLLLGVGITAEFVVRGQLDRRVASLGSSLPGVTVSSAGGSALVQLATGRVTLEAVVSDAALAAMAECRTEQDLSVRSVDGGVVVTTERTVRGLPLQIEVLLVPQRDLSGRWRLTADSVSAGGISLPAERALKVLSGRDGASAGLASRLMEGIPISGDALDILDLAFAAGAVTVTAEVPTSSPSPADGGTLSQARSCLQNEEDDR